MPLQPFFLAVTPPSLTPQSLRMYASSHPHTLTPSHTLTSPSTPSHLTHKVDGAVIIDLDTGVVTCHTHDPPSLPPSPSHSYTRDVQNQVHQHTYISVPLLSSSPTRSNQLSEGIELTFSLFIQVHTADEEKLFHRGNATVIFPYISSHPSPHHPPLLFILTSSPSILPSSPSSSPHPPLLTICPHLLTLLSSPSSPLLTVHPHLLTIHSSPLTLLSSPSFLSSSPSTLPPSPSSPHRPSSPLFPSPQTLPLFIKRPGTRQGRV